MSEADVWDARCAAVQLGEQLPDDALDLIRPLLKFYHAGSDVLSLGIRGRMANGRVLWKN